MSFEERFKAARKTAIEKDYMNLNPEQRKAVMATEGPLLLLAGAGSGKTTVLIHRVANLLTYGCGADSDEIPDNATDEDIEFLETCGDNLSPKEHYRKQRLCAVRPAEPWSIIAITFTNKAANELKERLEKRLGDRAEGIWAYTFHRACVRILRRDIDRLGFDKNFTIYDTNDSIRVIKDIVKELSMTEKELPARAVLSAISNAKDKMMLPDAYSEEYSDSGDWQKARIAKVYKRYVRRLKDSNALDFDDIILHTVVLMHDFPEVREYYQEKFKYVLVDEYQDTNYLQYKLVHYLAGKRKNICVVGDDDQSIYRFRGADLNNILNFEQDYSNARTIRLEQNYRSTQNILDAANCVIRKNDKRKGKELWTGNGEGDKVNIMSLYNEAAEADYVVNQILKSGGKLGDNAVLYRMNALSQQLERSFRANGIKPKVVGGQAFYERAEVKDMLAYLCVVNNPADDLRLRRIINVPVRGIGNTTVAKIQEIAQSEGVPMFQIMLGASEYPSLSRAAGKLADFAVMIMELQGKSEVMTLDVFYDELCNATKYISVLEAKNDIESRSRADNIRELRSSIVGYMQNHPEGQSLADFLNEISLYTDLDSFNESDDAPVLMTVHAAKGLEFPNVYIVGMEEELFPSRMASSDEDFEEERRLCYVAMTRAKQHLTMTYAGRRMLFGETRIQRPSRFLDEVPEENSQWTGKKSEAERFAFDGSDFASDFGGYHENRRENSGPVAKRYSGSGYTTYGSETASKNTFKSRPRISELDRSPAAKTSSASLALVRGDMVNHTSFGKGMVLSVQKMGNDALIEIAFDKTGTKRLMLNTASKFLTKE